MMQALHLFLSNHYLNSSLYLYCIRNGFLKLCHINGEKTISESFRPFKFIIIYDGCFIRGRNCLSLENTRRDENISSVCTTVSSNWIKLKEDGMGENEKTGKNKDIRKNLISELKHLR
jgi:hypothetical protein